jgi:hypothetical protein
MGTEEEKLLALLQSKDEINHQLAFELIRNQPNLQTHLERYLDSLIENLHKNHSYTYNLVEELSLEEISAFEQNLKSYFSGIFGADFVKERFSLPIDFKAYLNLGCGFYQDSWRSVYPYHLIEKATIEPHYDFEIEDLIERVKEGNLYENDTLWLCIGYWSDKHDYFICCDKGHPYFGKVFDYNDAFPYGNYDYESYCSSFLTFLRSFSNDTLWEY